MKEFQFETQYNQRAMTAMAKTLRKTIRRVKSRRSHIFGWIVVVLALLLACWSADDGFGFKLEMRSIITFTVSVVLIIALIWEDNINGYFARRRLLPGTERSRVTFKEDEFVSDTDIGTSTFGYDKIQLIAENSDYFVFIFNISHAQVYDKNKISGGAPEEFRIFIEGVTNKSIVRM